MQCQSILVVEDNQDIRDTLEDVLKTEGYRVYSVKNGHEAMAALKRIPGPSLILLDMMMPGMDGWAFLEAQKNDYVLAKLPVVVVSALSAAKALTTAGFGAEEGKGPIQAVGYLRKPVAFDALMDVVEQHCGKGDRELARLALQSPVATSSGLAAG
jgi:two-component system chemotaxis response regulator CheY